MSDTTARNEAPVTLKLVVCDLCGVPFGIPAALFDKLVAYRSTVCCPSGHVRPIGVEPPHETRIRQLEMLVAAHGEQLLAANAENQKLRRSIIDRLVGPETAPDSTSGAA